LSLRRLHQCLDDLVQRRRAVGAGPLRPDQGDRLGEVADIIVGQVEKDRVDAARDQFADGGRLDGRDVEVAGDGRDRPSARRIGRVP